MTKSTRQPVCHVCQLSEREHIERADEADHTFIQHLAPPENTQIIAAIIRCPKCNAVHADEDGWDVRPHRTHKCLSCGILFDVTVRGCHLADTALVFCQAPPELLKAVEHLRAVLDVGFDPTPTAVKSSIREVLAWLDEITENYWQDHRAQKAAEDAEVAF